MVMEAVELKEAFQLLFIEGSLYSFERYRGARRAAAKTQAWEKFGGLWKKKRYDRRC